MGASRCTMAVLRADRAVPGRRRDEDVYGLGGGECHKLIQMSLPIGLYRARKLLETPRMGRVWKVLEKPRGIHTILHYGGRHERSPRLSREF